MLWFAFIFVVFENPTPINFGISLVSLGITIGTLWMIWRAIVGMFTPTWWK